MLFKLRMNAGLQYRGAAISGVVTQFVWGFLLITLFQLLGQNSMTAEEIATYFWLNQALIAMNIAFCGPKIFTCSGWFETGLIVYPEHFCEQHRFYSLFFSYLNPIVSHCRIAPWHF